MKTNLTFSASNAFWEILPTVRISMFPKQLIVLSAQWLCFGVWLNIRFQ